MAKRPLDTVREHAVEDLVGSLLIEAAANENLEYGLSLAAGWLATCNVVIFGDSMLLLELPKDGRISSRKVIAALEQMLTAAVKRIRPRLQVLFLEGVA